LAICADPEGRTRREGVCGPQGHRWYAVIYEGHDPVTGRERRRWHAAGTVRADAERLAARLAGELDGRNDAVRSMTFGVYLTTRGFPVKRVVLADSTYDGYRRNVERHVLPTLGSIALRRLRPDHLEGLHERLLHPRDGTAGLAPKTVYEVHLVIRGALADATRRGLVSRNAALSAHAPRLRSIAKVEQHAWTVDELRAILRAAAGHRLIAAFWVAANTGMRRNELLGLRWDDFDPTTATVSINRGLIAVAYELHETRGKTRNARRSVDLDSTTVEIVVAWWH
jgi:integrase